MFGNTGGNSTSSGIFAGAANNTGGTGSNIFGNNAGSTNTFGNNASTAPSSNLFSGPNANTNNTGGLF